MYYLKVYLATSTGTFKTEELIKNCFFFPELTCFLSCDVLTLSQKYFLSKLKRSWDPISTWLCGTSLQV